METKFEIIRRKDFNNEHRNLLACMLKKQGKVSGNLEKKIDKCNSICIAWIDNDVAGIGAIKNSTRSDFSTKKSGLTDLSNNFLWELGYFYTKEEFSGKGIASMIAKLLIENYGNGNLMASTEITANPAMVSILKKNDFCFLGKPWKSDIHGNYLGLFLKFEDIPIKSS